MLTIQKSFYDFIFLQETKVLVVTKFRSGQIAFLHIQSLTIPETQTKQGILIIKKRFVIYFF